jgi:capsular exopolysaccharide synthesis family protein
MSRIYDALQRADLERKTAQATGSQAKETEEIVEPLPDNIAEELTPQKTGLSPENVVPQAWNPVMDYLPTLGDRGESIEQFRGLRSQIYQFREQGPLKTILISSGVPAEGKSFVATNLAISLARNKNNHILLIDADLRGPSLHTVLGAPKTPGLAEYLAGTAEVGEILQRDQKNRVTESGSLHSTPNLTFIPAGVGGDNSSELVANHRIEGLIETLAPHFDWILIDTPPALAFADAIDLAHAADAVLLVARAASTPYDVAQRVQAAFNNSRILGFVLNAVTDAPRNTSYYYYDYQESGSGTHHGKDKRHKG